MLLCTLISARAHLKRHRHVSARPGLGCSSRVCRVIQYTVLLTAAGLTGLKSCGSLPPANVGSSLNHTSKLPLLWSGMKNKGRDLKFITITRGNRDPTMLLLGSSCCRRVMIRTFLSFAFVRGKFDISLSEGRIWCFTLATHNSFSPF